MIPAYIVILKVKPRNDVGKFPRGFTDLKDAATLVGIVELGGGHATLKPRGECSEDVLREVGEV